jgi:glycosyltransferase involved in cell wall biosynthesis
MVAHAQKRFLCAREGIDAANVTVIHNGIPLSRLRSEKSLELSQMDIRLPDSKIVGIVARLVLEKDHRTFLRAAEILSRRLKNVFFLVVGDGPERRALERFAEDLGLAGRVRFLGNRDAIGEILPLFDVGILSSSDETFPVSIQEIMAFEKPVVVTDVGGVREMIDHGSEGYVVPPHNPTLLAESIYDLLTHAEKARSMGKQGCARIEREFTADKMAHEFEQLYEAVLAS